MKKKMQDNKLIQIALILSVLLTPSTVFSYSVLWDTSHGVYVSPTYGGDGYQPSGYYQELTQHLVGNGFTVDTTSEGFTDDNLAACNVAVVCVTSAYYTEYTLDEASRIADFVAAGGGLLIMGDKQTNPNANIQPVANEFADEFVITLGVSDVVGEPGPDYYKIYTSELDLSHPVFDGFDEDDQIFMHAAGELSVSSPAFSIAEQEVTGKIVAAVAQYGQGRIVALGDSSLWSWVETYEENFYEVYNPQFSVNTFEYLAIPEPATVLLLGLGSLILLRKRIA